jgi:glucose-6-phosphate 1-dehydrogenase
MVILGAGGDLARRKLMPALFHLMGDGLLSDDFNIVGVARGSTTDDSFRDAMHGPLAESEAGVIEPESWTVLPIAWSPSVGMWAIRRPTP